MKAVVKTARISPKKLNLIAELVRGKKAQNAMEILKYTPKKSAKILEKALKSAVANATNNFKQDMENLYIKEIVVSKAPTYKRWQPVSRGRVHPILKRNSHLKITIAVNEPETKKTEKSIATKTIKKVSKKEPAKTTNVK